MNLRKMNSANLIDQIQFGKMSYRKTHCRTPQIFGKLSKIRGWLDKGSKKAILEQSEIKIWSKLEGGWTTGGKTMGFTVFISPIKRLDEVIN